MICDSTNVFSPGMAGSEEGVRTELTKLIAEFEGRGVAVASFASNVARRKQPLRLPHGAFDETYDGGREIHWVAKQDRGATL